MQKEGITKPRNENEKKSKPLVADGREKMHRAALVLGQGHQP